MSASGGAAPPKSGATELTVRGEQRRTELLSATLRVIVRDGVGGVTYRAVAAEAHASHGSILYYFGSREALLHDVMVDVARRNAATLEAYWSEIAEQAHDPLQFAALLSRHSAQHLAGDRDMGIAVYELQLAAARDPALRDVLRNWGRSYTATAESALRTLGSTDPAGDMAQLTNAIGGLIVGQLALPRRDFERRVLRPAVERLVLAIAGSRTHGRGQPPASSTS
jgi:DNA-binding transcriptional regulator YbjK